MLSHTADAGLEATATTFVGLVEELATGMFELIAPVDPAGADRAATVEVASPTVEDLVVDMLSELLYRAEVDDTIFCDFAAQQPDSHTLKVVARGCDSTSIELGGTPIKVVTYHDLVVRQDESGWYGRVYFDV